MIGVPIASPRRWTAREALAITAQMPTGVPVATVGVDAAVNAAVLAAQIVGVGRPRGAGAPVAVQGRPRGGSAAVIPRYSLPEMAAVWSDEARMANWLEIEICAVEARAELGEMPRGRRARGARAGELLARARRASSSASPATTSPRSSRPSGSRPRRPARWLHFGMTSSDVLDTGLALQLRSAADLLLDRLEGLLSVVKRLALEHRGTVMVGRSHGIHAEPTSFGHKLAIVAFELDRDRERLRRAREVVSVGKISGAVGTYASVDPRVEELVCARLGLRPAEASSQIIQRDRHAEFLAALAITASTLDKIGDRDPPPRSHRGARGAGAVRRGTEGLLARCPTSGTPSRASASPDSRA